MSKNPVPKRELKKAIADRKKYLEHLAQILYWDVTITVKKL
jgi:hypothetical protein